jgi:hypothetical protein
VVEQIFFVLFELQQILWVIRCDFRDKVRVVVLHTTGNALFIDEVEIVKEGDGFKCFIDRTFELW